MSVEERRRHARARALRAARVVTLAASLASCSSRSHAPTEDAGLDAALADAAAGDAATDASVADAAFDADTTDAETPTDAALADATTDADPLDAAPSDAGTDAALADAGFDAAACTDFPPTTPECCESAGGFWEAERCIVAVPGPFVPPRMA